MFKALSQFLPGQNGENIIWWTLAKMEIFTHFPTGQKFLRFSMFPVLSEHIQNLKMVISTLKNAIFGPLHFSDVSYTSWPDRSEIRKSILGRIFSLIQMPFGTAVDDIKKGLQTKFQVFGLINAFWGIFQKNNKWHFSRKHN